MIGKVISAAAALALASGAMAAAPQQASEGAPEASIAFPQHSVRNFKAVGRDTLYLQGAGRQWYRASLMGPCLELPWAQAIGIETGGTSSLDRFGTIIAGGERCHIRSLVKSDAPPKKAKRSQS